MRNISAMVVSLVALVLVTVGLMSNPNPAFAAKTSAGQTHSVSADAQAELHATSVQVSGLQAVVAEYRGRISAAEERARLLEARADAQEARKIPSTTQIREDIRVLKDKVGKIEEDLRTRPTRGEFNALVLRVEKIENNIVTINNEIRDIKARLNTLEEAFRPMAWGMGSLGLAVRNPMSTYGVSGASFNPGLDFGLGLENDNLGVVMQGNWKAELGGELAGQTFGGSAVAYSRTFQRADIGGGLAVSTTRLVDSESILRYTATGPGLTVVALGRPPKRGGQHLHMQWKVQGTMTFGQTYAYGEGYGVKPQFALSVGLGAAATSRTE